MRNQPHLNKTIDDWERLWKLLNKKLSMLNEQLRLETRSDEKLRLSNLIEKTEIQLDQALLNYIHQRGVVIY